MVKTFAAAAATLVLGTAIAFAADPVGRYRVVGTNGYVAYQ